MSYELNSKLKKKKMNNLHSKLQEERELCRRIVPRKYVNNISYKNIIVA